MAWSVGQMKKADIVGANTGTLTFSSTPTTGNKEILAVGISSNNTQQTTRDGNSNNLTQIAANASAANGGVRGTLFAYDVPAAPSTTLTTTFLVVVDFTMVAMEVSGLLAGNTTAMVDGTAGLASAATQTVPSATYSSTALNEFLVNVYTDNGESIATAVANSYTANTANVDFNSDPTQSGHADCCIFYKNSTNGSEANGFTVSGGANTGEGIGLKVAFKLAATTPTVPSRPPRVAPVEPPRPSAVYVALTPGNPQTFPPIALRVVTSTAPPQIVLPSVLAEVIVVPTSAPTPIVPDFLWATSAPIVALPSSVTPAPFVSLQAVPPVFPISVSTSVPVVPPPSTLFVPPFISLSPVPTVFAIETATPPVPVLSPSWVITVPPPVIAPTVPTVFPILTSAALAAVVAASVVFAPLTPGTGAAAPPVVLALLNGQAPLDARLVRLPSKVLVPSSPPAQPAPPNSGFFIFFG